MKKGHDSMHMSDMFKSESEVGAKETIINNSTASYPTGRQTVKSDDLEMFESTL